MEALVVSLVIALLIFLNGLYVAAEFALVSVPRSSVAEKADRGGRLARRLMVILENPRQQDLYIAATQLGVTLASLGLGMYGEHAVAEGLAGWFRSLGMDEGSFILAHTLASVLAVVLLTVLHVVVGEMVPKTLALGSPQLVSWITLPVALSTRFVFYPLVRMIEFLSNRLLKLLGVDRASGHSSAYHTEEDLRHIVQESRAEGLLQTEAGKVVSDLLEFGSLVAEDVMVPRVNVRGIELGASPEQIRHLLREHQHTRFVVFEESLDNILGMVHIKDLLRLLQEDKPLRRGAVRNITFVPESMGVNRVLRTMRRDRTHIVVVMDEQGGTAGVLTVRDFFEEIVGNIDEDVAGGDEHHDAWRTEDGILHVAGTLRMDELAEELATDLPETEVETVSGLVLLLLGRPAQVGDKVDFGAVALEVLQVEGRGVKECTAVLLHKASSNELMETRIEQMTDAKEELLRQLDSVVEVLAELPLDDVAAAEAALIKHFPPDGDEVRGIRDALAAAEGSDWLLTKEAGGVRFGRLAKDRQGFSIDVVLSNGPGPEHVHPKGEVDLLFAWDGDPLFDGYPEGWAVYPPDSQHVPAVAGGTMMILYFLPEGMIRWV